MSLHCWMGPSLLSCLKSQEIIACELQQNRELPGNHEKSLLCCFVVFAILTVHRRLRASGHRHKWSGDKFNRPAPKCSKSSTEVLDSDGAGMVKSS